MQNVVGRPCCHGNDIWARRGDSHLPACFVETRLRGVYPYLPMATNAPWTFGGGQLKSLIMSFILPLFPLRFSAIISQTIGNFCPNFIGLLCVPVYDRLQIFIQLSPTLMKLCHDKCDQPGCVSTDGGQWTFWAWCELGSNDIQIIC